MAVLRQETGRVDRSKLPTDNSPEAIAARAYVHPEEAVAVVRREQANPPKGPLRPGAPGYGGDDRKWVAPTS